MLIAGSYIPAPELTVEGAVQASLPYYLYPDSLQGQLPADVELGIETTYFSPGVRRMQALMG